MEWEGEKKLWVIVPAQCTQLNIVQVLRASAITAQLMPVAWLRLQLRITMLGPEQGGEKKKELIIEFQLYLWEHEDGKNNTAGKHKGDDTVSIYAISQRPRFSP